MGKYQIRMFNAVGNLCEHKIEDTKKDISDWMHHYMHGCQQKDHLIIVEHLDGGCLLEQMRFVYFDNDEQFKWGWIKTSEWSCGEEIPAEESIQSVWPN